MIYDNKNHKDIKGEDLAKIFEPYCTCNQRKFHFITDPKTKFNGYQPKINTFGVCPINGLAGLLGRHLYTKQSPNSVLVQEFEQFIKPIID